MAVHRIEIHFIRVQLLIRVMVREILAESRIEKQGRLFKLIKNKNKHAEQQDAELHRDFAYRVKHQTEPALTQ